MYRVMIVDDLEISRLDLKRRKIWGDVSGFVIVDEAVDGVEALEKLKTNPVDMIITDIKMPKMDGIELLEQISKDNLCPYVVLLSDFTEYLYARKVFLNGAFDYLGKPIRDSELANLLERVKKSLEENHNRTLPSVDVQPALSPAPIIKCFGRFVFKVGDTEVKFLTNKAKELFIYLICNHYKQIFRDDLINLFFNTGDDKKDANNLRVTLFRIRQTLMTAGISKEHVLIKDDYSVRIAPGVCDIVDFLDFFEKNKVFDKNNIANASRIIDLFRGDLLTDIDTFWINDMREFLQVEIENLMIKMAMYYHYTAGKPLKAEYLLLKLTEVNPLSEQGHLALLDLCIKTNNKGKYVYYYRRYRESIKKDLGCEPEETYRENYEKYINLV